MTPAQQMPLYENGPYWVCKAQFDSGRFKPKSNGYEVYETGVTHSKRVAHIGWDGQKGLDHAKAEADKRAAEKKGDAA
jgi:hypothetical protein